MYESQQGITVYTRSVVLQRNMKNTRQSRPRRNVIRVQFCFFVNCLVVVFIIYVQVILVQVDSVEILYHLYKC